MHCYYHHHYSDNYYHFDYDNVLQGTRQLEYNWALQYNTRPLQILKPIGGIHHPCPRGFLRLEKTACCLQHPMLAYLLQQAANVTTTCIDMYRQHV